MEAHHTNRLIRNVSGDTSCKSTDLEDGGNNESSYLVNCCFNEGRQAVEETYERLAWLGYTSVESPYIPKQ